MAAIALMASLTEQEPEERAAAAVECPAPLPAELWLHILAALATLHPRSLRAVRETSRGFAALVATHAPSAWSPVLEAQRRAAATGPWCSPDKFPPPSWCSESTQVKHECGHSHPGDGDASAARFL